LTVPRVAFFTDSFHEVNGVARTSREFARFARNQNYPFFSVHTGPQTGCWTEGNLTTCELKLSWASPRLERISFLICLPVKPRSAFAEDKSLDAKETTGNGSQPICGAATFPAFFSARIWHAPMPIWTSSYFLPGLTLSATSC
jgi:hypothetical protein